MKVVLRRTIYCKSIVFEHFYPSIGGELQTTIYSLAHRSQFRYKVSVTPCSNIYKVPDILLLKPRKNGRPCYKTSAARRLFSWALAYSWQDCHGRRQDFLCRGQSGGKAEGLGGKEKSILLNINRTRSSADADNRLDAFSGQSRSTNMVPFHM